MKTWGGLGRMPVKRFHTLFPLSSLVFVLMLVGDAGLHAGPLDDHTQTHQNTRPTLSSLWVNKNQSCAGSIGLQPASAKPGDLVTISVTIAVNSEAVGRVDITTPSGGVSGSGAGGGVYQHWWTVPDTATGNIPISFVAYPIQSGDLNPPVICAGAASLSTPDALSVGLGGDTQVWIGNTGTWTATVSGGSPPYTYEWQLFGASRTDGPTNSTTSTQQRVIRCRGGRPIEVRVQDDAGKSASASFNVHALSLSLAVSLNCTAEVEVGDDANYYATVANADPPFDFRFNFSDGESSFYTGVSAYGANRTYTAPGVINLLVTAIDRKFIYNDGTFENVQGAAACSTRVIASSNPPPGNPCGSGTCNTGQFCCHDSSCCDANANCCDNGLCCANQGVCCYPGGCCPAGKTCCGSGCCPGGTQCCPGATACCTGLSQCCGSGCCPEGTYCCGNGQCCMN